MAAYGYGFHCLHGMIVPGTAFDQRPNEPVEKLDFEGGFSFLFRCH
jgi:hypothetical protein